MPKIENEIGIEVYASSSAGVGGFIRRETQDFVVEEVLADGSKATIEDYGRCSHTVLGSASARDHYLLSVLVKRNWDMFMAIKEIAKELDISPNRIQIAGIKDAKAVTAQHVTIDGKTTKDVEKVHLKDIELRPIGYLHNMLSTFYLLGNIFHISIRGVKCSQSMVRKRVFETIEELRAVGGVPNFFGHQRFGTIRTITHLVGKAIIKGDLRKAAMLFLAKPSVYEHPESRLARERLWRTQDFDQALKEFPKQLRFERLMLRHLVRKTNDFSGAFRTLPMKLRELFVQAYQSYLFNRFLSARIKQGLPLNRVEAGDFATGVEHSGLPMVKIYKIVNANTQREINTAISEGRMRIAIPLAGFRQRFSQGFQGEIERHVLEEQGISAQDFRTTSLPETNEKGTLRPVVTPLNDFSLDEILHDPTDPSRQMVKLSFTLLRASYATVLLRELMKSRNVIKAGF